MRVEVWADLACPWCYLGKRRLERALGSFEQADQVSVEWRSFQLDPEFPVGVTEPEYEMLARKFGVPRSRAPEVARPVVEQGAEVGIAYDYDRILAVNTFDAHRLLQLGKALGNGDAVTERLFRAHFVEGESLADHATLQRLGAEAGVPPGDAQRALAGTGYADQVRADIRDAQQLGVSGVPFFVIDRRYGVSGAQPPDVLAAALRRAGTAG